jgi:hypothetical protein
MINRDGFIMLKATCQRDFDLAISLFRKKHEWEQRNMKEFTLLARLELNYQKRTHKQLASVFALVTAIFESMEGRKPTEEEKYSLYDDLLEVYADRVPCRFKKNATRPVRISEANSIEGARFIDGLIYHLATECNLDYGTQSTVADILWQWESYRGTLDVDPLDYTDIGCTELMPVEVWRERHPYSEASGRTGDIVRAHIVSRGSDTADIEKTWNWIALLHEEHMQQHQIGWDAFLQIYPHLRGRVDRARNLAGKLELEFKREQRAIEYKPDSLAVQALEGT